MLENWKEIMEFKIKRGGQFVLVMIMAGLAVVLGWGNSFDWDFQNFGLAMGFPVWLLFWLFCFFRGIKTP